VATAAPTHAAAYKIPLAQRELGLGRRDAARALLDELAANDFAALPGDANAPASWALAPVVAAFGDRERAIALAAKLEPYSGRLPVIARAAGCHFPSEYYLGILAATAGHVAKAADLLTRALATAERIDARPAAAATRWRLGTVLATRAPGASRRLLANALTDARALGLRSVAAGAERALESDVTRTAA
jgi:hypothetical protein